ncbi:MAG: hypothetical protein ACI8T1_002783 [Verrucomicrobiales bacterium]|jgi:hypothetical protein
MKALSQPTKIPETPTFHGVENEDLWQVPGYQRILQH